MALLSFDKPIFESNDAVEAKEFISVQRIAFDHDKGGAINGGGRVDLFWGRGPLAKQAAGVMKSYGTLYYLAPKEELLKRLPSMETFK
jgi:membrane-bound lytic murein transglycosylase A